MTGAMASMTGVPSEVVLVRMAADNKLPLVRPTPRPALLYFFISSPHIHIPDHTALAVGL